LPKIGWKPAPAFAGSRVFVAGLTGAKKIPQKFDPF
jgi:hypothetical protein